MEQRVMGFIAGLRARGVTVSPAETMDAMRALRSVDVSDAGQFKAALRSTLVKRSKDQPAFDELFSLHFYGLAAPGDATSMPDQLQGRLPDALAAFSESSGSDLNELLSLMLQGDPSEWEPAIEQMAEGMGMGEFSSFMQVGMYSRRIFDRFDWPSAVAEMEELLRFLAQEGWEDAELESLRDAFEARRAALREQVRRYLERDRRRGAGDPERRNRMEKLMAKQLSQLDEREMAMVRDIVYELARKLRNRLALRERRQRRGRLDVRRTLRRNMAHGGIPFELALRRRPREKVELWVLCDVSSSVARVSQFMLQFVYTVQDCLAKVRSFVFVDEIGEVTDFFREQEVEEGIRMALTAADITYNARSDFGHVFREFNERYLSEVGYRTFVLIIGDARNNFSDSRAGELARIAERARGIVWLNPETVPF